MERAKELILAFLSHLVYTVLGMCMTSHTKRFVLLTSLHVHMVHEGIIREEALSKLNRALDLVKYEDALELPTLLHEAIWGKLRLRNIVPETDIVNLTSTCLPYSEVRRISAEVVSKTPKWLRYGQEDVDMLQDVMRLFYCQPELHAAQGA